MHCHRPSLLFLALSSLRKKSHCFQKRGRKNAACAHTITIGNCLTQYLKPKETMRLTKRKEETQGTCQTITPLELYTMRVTGIDYSVSKYKLSDFRNPIAFLFSKKSLRLPGLACPEANETQDTWQFQNHEKNIVSTLYCALQTCTTIEWNLQTDCTWI